LAVISDVSCDPLSPHNTVPIYKSITTLQQPALRILEGDNPLDVIAIDHLPSLLPRESSEFFCGQLIHHLKKSWKRKHRLETC